MKQVQAQPLLWKITFPLQLLQPPHHKWVDKRVPLPRLCFPEHPQDYSRPSQMAKCLFTVQLPCFNLAHWNRKKYVHLNSRLIQKQYVKSSACSIFSWAGYIILKLNSQWWAQMKHKSHLHCQDLYYSTCSKIFSQQELPKLHSKCSLMLFWDDLGLASRLSPISHLLQYRELALSWGCWVAESGWKNSILQVVSTTSTISWLKGVSHLYHETSDKNVKPPAGRGCLKTLQQEPLLSGTSP